MRTSHWPPKTCADRAHARAASSSAASNSISAPPFAVVPVPVFGRLTSAATAAVPDVTDALQETPLGLAVTSTTPPVEPRVSVLVATPLAFVVGLSGVTFAPVPGCLVTFSGTGTFATPLPLLSRP